MVGVSSSYDGYDAAGVVFDTDECALDVLWITAVVVLDVAVLGVGLVELEIGWLALDGAEVVLECALGVFLEFEVEGCFDGESAHFDVIFFEDDVELTFEGGHDVGLLVHAALRRADVDVFLHGGVCFCLGDEVVLDHGAEGDVAFFDGAVVVSEWGECVRSADDAG